VPALVGDPVALVVVSTADPSLIALYSNNNHNKHNSHNPTPADVHTQQQVASTPLTLPGSTVLPAALLAPRVAASLALLLATRDTL